MKRVVLRPYLAGLAISLWSVLLGTLLLRAAGQGATLLDVDVLRVLRRLLERLGANELVTLLPSGFRAWFPLEAPSDLCRFLLSAAPGSLLGYLLLATALIPAVAAGKRWVSSGEARAGRPWSRAAFPDAALLSALLFPAVFGVISASLPMAGSAPRLLLAAGGCGLLGIAIWRLAPDPKRIDVVLARAAAAAGVLVGMAAAAGWLLPDPRFTVPVAARPGAPNLLLISIDSLRADHLSCYGYERETSPTIDGLAREGVRFEHALSPTSWTLPSHATLLTGLTVERHGVNVDGRRLRDDVTTLAERLRARGYATAGFVSGSYLSAKYGFAQGFGHYDQTNAQAKPEMSHRIITSPSLHEKVMRWFADWERVDPPRPFFIFLHMWDPHYDYLPPPPFDSLFDSESANEAKDIEGDLSAKAKHLKSQYDGEIRFTDSYIARIVDHLRASGQLDDTLVVVTADHGQEFFEHGALGHRKTLYGESIRVPLVLRGPGGVPAGKVVAAPVGLDMVVPLVTSLLGVDAPEEATRTAQVRRLLDEEAPQADFTVFGELEGRLGYVRTADWKFITSLAGGGEDELYDLRDGLFEERSVAEEHPSVLEELRRRLSSYREKASTGGDLSETTSVGRELEEQLRALGYVE